MLDWRQIKQEGLLQSCHIRYEYGLDSSTTGIDWFLGIVPQIELAIAQTPPLEPFDGTRPSADPKVHGLCSAEAFEG